MSDSEFDFVDFIEQDPELKKMYDDDSWMNDDKPLDPEVELDAQKYLLQSGVMSYPAMLLEMFSTENQKTEQKGPEIPYPRKSFLTTREMQRYLKWDKLYKQTRSISEVKPKHYKEYKDYKALQSKVLKEQDEFQQYLLIASARWVSKYNHVDKEASEWMKKRTKCTAKDAKQYARYYIHLKDFGISVIPFKNDTLPAPIQNLIHTLRTPKHLATITKSTKIPKDINQKPKRKNVEVGECWDKGVISEDQNAFRLAIAWNADVVISLGTLQTLADNHAPFPKEWELPVIIRTYEGMEFDEKRKVAFINKALPPKRIAPREKNCHYFKEVSKFLSEVPDVWGKFPADVESKKTTGIQKKAASSSDNLVSSGDISETDKSHDEGLILQLDGANDEKLLLGESHQSEKLPQEWSRHDSKLILQVDGANDEKAPSKNIRPTKLAKNTYINADSEQSSQKCLKIAGKSLSEVNKSWMSSAKLTSFTTHDPKTGFTELLSNKNDQSLPLADNEGFQPFLGRRKSVQSLVIKDKKGTKKDEAQSEMSEKEERSRMEKKQNTSGHKFSAMSFGLLPDSALEVSQDESDGGEVKKPEDLSQIEAPKSTKIQKAIKLECAEEMPYEFTPRRSLRNKNKSQTIQQESLPPSSKSVMSMFERGSQKAAQTKGTTSTPVSKKEKKKRRKSSRIIEINSDTNSDDETLSVIKKKAKKTKVTTKPSKSEKKSTTSTTSSEPSVVDETNDVIGQILPAISQTKTQGQVQEERSNLGSLNAQDQVNDVVSNLGSLKPFTPSDDLLGQILGKQTTSARSRQEVRSAWVSEAETMRKVDPDLKYSTTDLNLHLPAQNKNVTYVLWKFGKKRVLIRYSLHGVLVTPILQKGSQEFHCQDGRKPSGVSLRTKLEYQSDHVFEQLTMSEICRDWVTMLFKRPSKIVRVRIDPHKREILDVEWTMTLNHLQHKAEKIGYNSAVTSKLLIKLLEMIGELQKGSYIISHRENENKIIVRQAVDDINKKVVYDLHREYSNPGRDVFYTNSVPWVPGDPNKPRKSQSLNDRIPLTFDPKEETDADRQKGAAPRGSKSGKKKKQK